MKELRFKIPELSVLPPEQRESVLRRCIDSEEYQRRTRKIRFVTLISAVVAAIATLNLFIWGDIVRGVPVGSIAVGTIVFFIVLMILSQLWLQIRLVRELVRKEMAVA